VNSRALKTLNLQYDFVIGTRVSRGQIQAGDFSLAWILGEDLNSRSRGLIWQLVARFEQLEKRKRVQSPHG